MMLLKPVEVDVLKQGLEVEEPAGSSSTSGSSGGFLHHLIDHFFGQGK